MLSPGSILHQINHHWRDPLDPTFGNLVEETTNYGDLGYYCCGTRFQITEAGTGQSITALIRWSSGASGTMYVAIYSDGAGPVPVNKLSSGTASVSGTTGQVAWYTANLSPTVSLTANSYYWLLVGGSTSAMWARYGSYSGYTYAYKANWGKVWPDPWNGSTGPNYRFSIYCTYTVAVPALDVKGMIGGMYLVFPA